MRRPRRLARAEHHVVPLAAVHFEKIQRWPLPRDSVLALRITREILVLFRAESAPIIHLELPTIRDHRDVGTPAAFPRLVQFQYGPGAQRRSESALQVRDFLHEKV